LKAYKAICVNSYALNLLKNLVNTHLMRQINTTAAHLVKIADKTKGPHVNDKKFSPSVLTAAVCAALGVGAIPATAESTLHEGVLEEIVVTASRSKERVFDSPATLSVITQEELDRSIAPTLAEMLRDVAGVQISDSGQPGMGRIRIRGEESRRTAVLINSQEVTDHHEVGTPLSLHPAMIERIEVVRGSGSVLYGSRALSGVVNFFTRKGGTEPLQASVSTSYDSATEGYSGFTSLFGNINGFEYRVAGAKSDYSDRATPEGSMDNTSYDNDALYLFAGKELGNHRLEYTYEDYQSSSHSFVEEEIKNTFPLTDFYLETPQRDRNRHALAYQLDIDNNWARNLEANAFHQLSKRQFYTRTETVWYERDVNSKDDLTTDGALVQLNFQPLGDHQLLAGIQYLNDDVDQTRNVDTNSWAPPTPSGSETIRDKASIETWAGFILDQWQIDNRLTLSAGLRQYFVDGDLDYTDRESLQTGSLGDDNKLIGTLGLVWDYSDDIRLRVNVAQGYVYPSLMQLATGAYAGSSFVNSDPNLKPETSINYETGIRLQKNSVVLDGTAFYTESKDYIHHQSCTEADNCPGARDRRYLNIGESNAHGVELYLAWMDGPFGIQPYTNLTWMKRRNEFETFSTWDSGIPDLSGRIGVRWEGTFAAVPTLWTDIYLRGESSSDLEEADTVRSELDAKESWVTANITTGVHLGSDGRYQLGLDLLNLTNKRYIASAENLYGAERSVAVKLTMAW
jgi:hemoglobin/transferrin/lactoferrin receptor protein